MRFVENLIPDRPIRACTDGLVAFRQFVVNWTGALAQFDALLREMVMVPSRYLAVPARLQRSG